MTEGRIQTGAHDVAKRSAWGAWGWESSTTLVNARVSGQQAAASLPGYSSQWIYPGAINVGGGKTGGDGAVVAEAGFGYTANSYIEFLTSSGREPNVCVTPEKQGTDTNSEYGLSAASVAE